jgi:hypothetical protein
MQALLLVAEHNGPTVFARIGVMRALTRYVERAFDSSRKESRCGKRKLPRSKRSDIRFGSKGELTALAAYRMHKEKPPAVSCRGFLLESCQTIGIRSYAERER